VQQGRSGFQKKSGFISARPFIAKQLRGHKKQSRPFNKKPRSAPGFIARVQQSRSGFRKMRLHFSTAFQRKATERSQKNKAALSTKKP
jgi:hypothetical protein